MTCPWLGLCDDATEVLGRKYEHCKGHHESCPTWNEVNNSNCRDCGRVVHDFIIPTKIWNHVIEDIHPDSYPNDVVPSEGAGGVWCYDCFCERAQKKGYIAVFKCELAHPYDSSKAKCDRR